MGKENKKRSAVQEKLNKIEQIQRDIQKEKKKIFVECSHQNDKGVLKIQPIGNDGEFQCKICKAQFNMNPVSKAKLEEAVKVVHDVIQQIRCLSNVDDDEKIIRLLGELDFNNSEVSELYDRTLELYSKGNGKGKKKNKNKDRGDSDGFGSYSSGGNISFIGGGGGGKRR